MKGVLEMSAVFPVSPEALYTAWMSSRGHTAFTGSKAAVDPKVGGAFSAWDGYISGVTEALVTFRSVKQRWRSTDFPDGHPDSLLDVTFEEAKGGTRFVLVHTGLPEGMEKDFEKGWKDYYLKPMKKYFAKHGKEKWEEAFRRPSEW